MSASCGRITVVEAFSEGDVSVSCSGLDTTGPINPGDTVVATFEFTNQNNTEVSVGYSINVDGQSVGAGAQIVPANGSESVNDAIEFNNTGTFDVTAEVTSVSQS